MKEIYQKKVNSIIKYANLVEFLILGTLCTVVKDNNAEQKLCCCLF